MTSQVQGKRRGKLIIFYTTFGIHRTYCSPEYNTGNLKLKVFL